MKAYDIQLINYDYCIIRSDDIQSIYEVYIIQL